MGRVYRARDLRLNRTVAVKVLAPNVHDRRGALVRLRREAETASGLNHPALVTIFDVGETPDGAVFIAMELVDGVSLRERLRQSPSFGEVSEALVQIADGLAAAHGAGVIHRDIKPENLMIGRHGYAKVIDFGLAKSTAAPESSSDTPTVLVTESGAIVGTVLYMAPEQLRGEPLDGACDVFALGGVLYECIAGRAPFAAKTQAETIARILHDEPAPLPSGIDPRLASLVTRMLAKDAAARPSMREVAEALRAIARAPSSSDAETVVLAARRRRRLLVPFIVAALLLLAAGLTWQWQRVRKPAAVRPSDAQTAELWARAQFFVTDPKWAVKDQSIPILEQVVQRDPRFLPARVELADQYARRAFAHDPGRAWEQKAFVEADRILRIDPSSPAAHTILAKLKWTRARGFPHQEALTELSKALAADPGYENALEMRASILMHIGLLDEALKEYELLRARDPADSAVRMRIARIRLWQGDYATALRELREYTPDNFQVAIALMELGRDDEAASFLQQKLSGPTGRIDTSDLVSARALVLARQGDRAGAEQLIAQSLSAGGDSSHFHHTMYNAACAHAALGNAAKSVELLEETSRQGMPVHALFANDPLLDPIRGDARFRRFIADSAAAFDARRRAIAPLLPQ